MSEILSIDDATYRAWIPAGKQGEQTFEEIVRRNYRSLFGADSLYFDFSHMIRTPARLGASPDGYALRLRPRATWYVVEVELASHEVYEHVVGQLGRFIAGITKQPQERRAIGKEVRKRIEDDPELEGFVRARIGGKDLYRFVDETFDELPALVVIIDERTPKLSEALDLLSGVEKRIVWWRTFSREGTESRHVHLIDHPLYAPREPMPPRPPLEVISGDELRGLPEGEVILCPSKPEGREFLLRHNAWGFVRVKRQPRYFALYVGAPESAVQFFAEVERVVDPKSPGSPVLDPKDYETYKVRKQLIVLRAGSLRQLAEPIKLGSLSAHKVPWGPRYYPLTRLASARTLADL